MRDSRTIRIKRLFLREIRDDDTDFIVELRSDPEVYRYFKHPHRLTAEEHEEWYRKVYLQNENIIHWICEKDGVNRSVRCGTEVGFRSRGKLSRIQGISEKRVCKRSAEIHDIVGQAGMEI